MTRVSATEFQNHVGRYLDAVQREPVIVTSHGRDRGVLISPELYQRLVVSVGARTGGTTYRFRNAWDPEGRPGKIKDPVGIALAVVNSSAPKAIGWRELRDAIRNPRTRYRAYARVLLNALTADVLASLVAQKFVTWRDFVKLANRVGVDDLEKDVLIRRMAGLVGPVGHRSAPRPAGT
jgi:prevent-host-death family protein